jgi:hypothetical protein
MSRPMAVATKKPKPTHSKPKPGKTGKAQPKAGRGKPAKDPLDDVEEPDRSSPSLAEVDAEVLEFIAAIDRFKKENGRPFPSWSEILLVLRELGYRRR